MRKVEPAELRRRAERAERLCGPPTAQGLTRAQDEVLRYIVSHLADHGTPPTLRGTMRAVGIGSPNGIMCHVRALIKKGWLRSRGEGVPFCYWPVGLRLVPTYDDTEQGRRLAALMVEETPDQE